MTRRAGPFVAVGALGFVLQLGVLAWLTYGWHWPYLVATVVAVEAAILHNFAWHECWTWADRRRARGPGATAARLARFHAGTGFVSLAGNVVVTAIGVEGLHLSALVANVAGVAVTSVANFLVADRWVFRAPATATLAALMLVMPGRAAAEPRPETVSAWEQFVKAEEAKLDEPRRDSPGGDPAGQSFGVPGGTIHEWRGSVRLSGITVGQLVGALQWPGLPPPADDVLDARVLQRRGDDSLHLYLKLTRSAIVTVTYDTEHDVTFQRVSPDLATSRSVSTSIREVDGSDRGFLWRLNSYWQYRQEGNAVVVDVLSLSLSRSVPNLVKPVAGPLIDRIARESMRRTLEAMNRFSATLRSQNGS